MLEKMSFKSIRSVLRLSAMTFALISCKTGTDSGKSEYIDHIKISKGAVAFEYTTTFGNNLEVDMEGEFPVGRYGSIAFYPDAKGRLNITFGATFELWTDLNLTTATTLPNGAKFPVIVARPLQSLLIADKPESYRMFAYVDQLTNPTQVNLAGLALEFANLKNNFPQISITQSFYNNEIKVASFTIYGPRTVNGKTLPGGIFLVGDINQLVNQDTNVFADQMFVHGPEAKNYTSIEAKKALAIKVQKALAANGIRVKLNP